jgi:hypothetical protein
VWRAWFNLKGEITTFLIISHTTHKPLLPSSSVYMVPSLLALCLSHIANTIERWSQHVTEFHIKEAQYLVTDMTRLPQDVVYKIIQELVKCKKLTIQNFVLFLDDQLQRIELPANLAIVNDSTMKVIARLAKNLLRYLPLLPTIFSLSSSQFSYLLSICKLGVA